MQSLGSASGDGEQDLHFSCCTCFLQSTIKEKENVLLEQSKAREQKEAQLAQASSLLEEAKASKNLQEFCTPHFWEQTSISVDEWLRGFLASCDLRHNACMFGASS